MKPIVIFRHVDCEGPGYLQDFLEARDMPTQLVRIDAGEAVPADPEPYAGLVFMGGGMSVNDDLDWIPREIALIRAALDQDLPVLGHCLGGQLIARALGARVGPNPVRELGWHPVWRRDNRAARDWFGDADGPRDCFHWHGETFELPDGAVPLLYSELCENQAFVQGRALAMQCHIEMTAPLVREWARRFARQLTAPSNGTQSAEAMLENLDARISRLHALADRVYSRWIEILRD